MKHPIVLHHNFEPDAFMWLWAKYVISPNLSKHCTASLKSVAVPKTDGKKSPYSQKFSKASNPEMGNMKTLQMDENGAEHFGAIYLCGVASSGYTQKKITLTTSTQRSFLCLAILQHTALRIGSYLSKMVYLREFQISRNCQQSIKICLSLIQLAAFSAVAACILPNLVQGNAISSQYLFLNS